MSPNDWSGDTDAKDITVSTVIAQASPAAPPTGSSLDEAKDAQPEFVGHGALSGNRLGPYWLKELLGVGGMAEVYRARDLARQRVVAVKVLASHLTEDDSYVAQFRDEARRAARLRHRHIVPLYGMGEEIVDESRVLYLVMPLLSRSLSQRLRREGSLPYPEALRLTLEAAAGLQAAHAAGLVHCDVKPGNILLDAEGHALLCDFGVALDTGAAGRASYQAAQMPATSPDSQEWVAGTPAYMAPEQLCGGAVDQRADVYSLGVVLYQLLTGRRPFEGDTPLDIATHALRDPVIPPSARAPNRALPLGLDRVLLTALARDPGERFGTMDAFATALRRVRTDPVESWDVWDRWSATAPLAASIPGAAPMPMPQLARSQRARGASISPARRWLCVAALAASLGCAAGLTTMLESWGVAGRPDSAAGISRIAPAAEARAPVNNPKIVITPRTPTATATATPTPTAPNAGGSGGNDDEVALTSSAPTQQSHGQGHGAAKTQYPGRGHAHGQGDHPKPEHAVHDKGHSPGKAAGHGGKRHGHGHGGKRHH